MKKNIHPKCFNTKIFTVAGKELRINSCIEQDLYLGADPVNHLAWTKKSRNSFVDSNVDAWNKKFGKTTKK